MPNIAKTVRMLNFRRMRKVLSLFSFAAIALLVACGQEPEAPVDHSAILYKGVRPMNVRVSENTFDENIPALQKRVDLRYPMQVGDTLDVCILEFRSDVYALDYYMNSGRFQGIVPILRGPYLEQSIRSDARIFIFRHDGFRRYERSDLENYVRSFPGYHGGFPQEFLSLPFEHREVGRTSIQTRNFLGLKSFFPVLVQSYRDANLQWNVARSWDQVDENVYKSWKAQLRTVEPTDVMTDALVSYFNVGEGVHGMATQLPGGRVVVVWGYLGWTDLERKFFTASDRIFEARF